MAQGYTQVEGVDFDESFAPVERLESIQILLSITCIMNFKLYQMDVKSAFLNRLLNEEVFVEQLARFSFSRPCVKIEESIIWAKASTKSMV